MVAEATGEPEASQVGGRLAFMLAERPHLTRLGVRLAEAAEGRVVLHLDSRDAGDVTDPAHGGFDRSLVITLGDAAGWLSVASVLGRDRPVATLEMTVDLVVPPSPIEVLEAVGVVVRTGRSLSSARVDVSAVAGTGERTRIGLMQVTYTAG